MSNLQPIRTKNRALVFLLALLVLLMNIVLSAGNVAYAAAPDWTELGNCIGHSNAQSLYMYKSESSASIPFASIHSLERYSDPSVSVTNIDDYDLQYVMIKSAMCIDPAYFIYDANGTLLCPPPFATDTEGVPYSEYYTVSVTGSGVTATKNMAKHEISHVTLFFSYNPNGSVSITKELDNTGTLGASLNPQFTFTLTGGPDSVNLQKTIGVGDTAMFDNLPYGTYTLSEGTLPDGVSFIGFNGYTAGQNPITINIGEEVKNVSVTATNHASGKVKIIKTDTSTGGALAGVTLRVSDDTDFEDNDTDFELVTGVDGTATSGWIEPGTYYVKEISAPSGYILESGYKMVIVPLLGIGEVSFENVPYGSVSITKELDNTGTLGASLNPQFTFTLTGGPDSVNLQKTIGVGDTAMFDNLPYGTYTLSEGTLPDGVSFIGFNGYTAGQNPITINIGEEVKNVSVTATNHASGKVKIIKTDTSTGGALAGVTLRVSDDTDFEDNDTDFELVTGVDGTATSGWIEPGTYYVKEISAPSGYILESGYKMVIVPLLGIGEVSFENVPYGSVSITKELDNTGTLGASLNPQFTFTLTGGPDSVNLQKTIGVGDTAMFDNLPYGTYTLSEGTLPDGVSFIGFNGYTAGQNPITINIGEEVKNISVTATNHASGKVKIIKTDTSTGGALAGVTLRVSDDTDFEDNDTDFELLTGVDGTATSGWIEPGTYYVKEISAPSGYILESGYKMVIVPLLGIGEVSFENDLYARLDLIKIDSETGQGIAGVEFEIYPVGDPTNIILLTTGTGGIVSHSSLIAGDYKIREVGAPDGYHFDPTVLIDVTLVEGETTVVRLENTPHCELMLRKVNAADPTQTLPGAKFELKRLDGQGQVIEILNVTIGEDGILLLDIIPGHWEVRETVAPEGFKIDTTVKEIDLELYDKKELIFENSPLNGSLKILKVDSKTKKPLGGAVFEIYADENLETLIVGNLVTSVDGTVLREDMVPGYYWIVETEAPEGYEKVFDVVKVEIVSDVMTEVEFANDSNGDYQTATNNFNLLILGGMLLLAGGTLLIISKLKKSII